MEDKKKLRSVNDKGASLLLVIAVMLFLLTLASMTLVQSNNLMNTVRIRYETYQTQAYMRSAKEIVNTLLSSDVFNQKLTATLNEAALDEGKTASDIGTYDFTIDGITDQDGSPIGITVLCNRSGAYKDRPLATITVNIEGEDYSFSFRFDKL